MTASTDTTLQGLQLRHPEWQPWLAVLEEVLRETASEQWEKAVPSRAQPQADRVPLVAGANLALDRNDLGRWTKRLFRTAARSGTPAMATLEAVAASAVDPFDLFKPALCQDRDRLRETARRLGADENALGAVAFLLPFPLLHALNRRWASLRSRSWTEGYCPVCGAWPAFAEVRGIERSRYLRCSRCGAEWHAHCLFCPYCGVADHNELSSLVPQADGASRIVEACERCLGYVKSFTTLQATPPAEVIVRDLASVDLDLAAVDRGYKRPEGMGYAFDVTIVGRSGGGLFSWNR
ncbi:MAG TPA: formate dehydrogenase accessory protein FdhE [Candidatus Acidoferrales bacterium]|nr:formate dehydrogenase accessory protein FdhE [Candidatus Acidoferrales bacterium]